MYYLNNLYWLGLKLGLVQIRLIINLVLGSIDYIAFVQLVLKRILASTPFGTVKRAKSGRKLLTKDDKILKWIIGDYHGHGMIKFWSW